MTSANVNFRVSILYLCTSCFLLTGCLFFTGCSSSADRKELNTTKATSKDNIQDKSVYLTFEANTIDGQALTSEIFSSSQLTMLNIWATYCNPCLTEMPDLSEIAKSYPVSDLQLVGIISDVTADSQEGIKTARRLLEETGADNYPQLLLNQSLYDKLLSGISSVPTTVFINQEGRVLGYVVGANDKDTWKQTIDSLLLQERGVDIDAETDSNIGAETKDTHN